MRLPESATISATSESTAQELLRKENGSDNDCDANLTVRASLAVSVRRRKAAVGLHGGRFRKYTPQERLSARTIKGPSCWEVTGYRLPNGYVQISRVFAHRLAWELANNTTVPKGLVVMHSCDNPVCVNPAHLSVGTQKDNVRDAVRKGRWTVRKLSDDDVAEIRALAAVGMFHKHIAKRFGVARNTVSAIVTGPARPERIGEPLESKVECA